MNSLIIDLQNDIFENKDIKLILNKSLMISNELELNAFNKWINLELNGYNDFDKLPQYRILECELRMNGPLYRNYPFPYHHSTEKLKEVRVHQSIYELINMCKSNEDMICFKFDSKLENDFKEQFNATDIYRFCPIFKVETIIDHVKKVILDLCSELRKNEIIGESYNFTDAERGAAKNINIIPIININLTINDVSNILKEISNELDNNEYNDDLRNEMYNNVDKIETELDGGKANIQVMKTAAQNMKDCLSKVVTQVSVELLLKLVDKLLELLSTYI